VPTQFSNLDSILVGYAVDQIMGLPSFSYGAGLNLYNFGPAAYYMNRLGAYRVDRRKKNAIYLETLKSMSNLSIQRGVNSLFFPGGTRSRSGHLETELKMGLLGTAVEAQREMAQKGSQKKVFIVPLVISYNFVLEAPFLIEQYLRNVGKENYVYLKDEAKSIRSWMRFLWRFFSTSSDIHLSVGKPMDVLGNFVDATGQSFDKFGNRLDIQEYFLSSDGKINADRQREEQYTQMLADKIVDRYRRENVVLASHLIAFAVFQILVKQHPKLDIFGILRLPPNDFVFPGEVVEDVVGQMLEVLKNWESEGRVKLAPELRRSVAEVVRDGVKNLGIYHQFVPLKFTREGDIVSTSFRTLFYYHNRLDNYGLEKQIRWRQVEVERLSEA
jgi:glycerol-3-phosphate O-acyltransferase